MTVPLPGLFHQMSQQTWPGLRGIKGREQERLEGERKGLYLGWGEREEGPFQSVSPRHLKGLVQMHQEQMELL